MDSGLTDNSQEAVTPLISLVGCTISGGMRVLVDGLCLVDSCVITGTLGATSNYDGQMRVTNSLIQGDETVNGVVGNYMSAYTVIGCTVRGLYYGLDDSEGRAEIRNNTIENCKYAGIHVTDSAALVSGNIVRRCGSTWPESDGAGIYVLGDDVTVSDNTVSGCPGFGLWAGVGDHRCVRVARLPQHPGPGFPSGRLLRRHRRRAQRARAEGRSEFRAAEPQPAPVVVAAARVGLVAARRA